MKAYTDFEQSEKLAEILPIESADQTWVRIAIAGANLDVPEELQYRHNGDMPFQFYSGIGIPCWSLAALMDVLDRGALFKTPKGWACQSYIEYEAITSNYYSNPIDAVFEMIVLLKENGKL